MASLGCGSCDVCMLCVFGGERGGNQWSTRSGRGRGTGLSFVVCSPRCPEFVTHGRRQQRGGAPGRRLQTRHAVALIGGSSAGECEACEALGEAVSKATARADEAGTNQ